MLRQVQQDKFPDDIQALQRGKKLPRESRILEFRPVLNEDGLLRVGGRLAHADLPMQSKHPVLLAEHHITQCLLKNYHEQLLHQGVEIVLARVRQEYWVLQGRRLLRKIKHACVTCRRYDAKAADETSTDLPKNKYKVEMVTDNFVAIELVPCT